MRPADPPIDSHCIDGQPLRLCVIRNPPDSADTVDNSEWVELRLQHLQYSDQLRGHIRNFVIFAVLYALHLWYWGIGYYPVDGLAFGVFVLLFKRAYQTVESETVILSKHLALQVTTTFAWGRSAQRHLVPVGSVRDIIINEVFYNLQVIYALNALIEQKRRGTVHATVVPLLLTQARVDVLQRMYQELQAVLKCH